MGWRRPSADLKGRTARWAGVGLVSVVASVSAMYLLLPLAVRALVRGLTLTVSGCVWVAASMSAGADPWTLAAAVGRAAADTLVTREASGILLALAVVGALAFYWLQRLLGANGESSQ